MEEIKFKTGQEVLVRDYFDENWKYDLYSHFNGKCVSPHRTISGGHKACIAYKGNESLVGTTDNPKEDLPIDIPVMASNYPKSNSNIETEVINTIVEVLECDKNDITNNTNLFNDLGADSLDATEIMMKLEKVFNIRIKDEEVLYKTEYEKIGNICNYIREQLNK